MSKFTITAFNDILNKKIDKICGVFTITFLTKIINSLQNNIV